MTPPGKVGDLPPVRGGCRGLQTRLRAAGVSNEEPGGHVSDNDRQECINIGKAFWEAGGGCRAAWEPS